MHEQSFSEFNEMEVSGMNQLSDQAKEELLHALEGKQSGHFRY